MVSGFLRTLFIAFVLIPLATFTAFSQLSEPKSGTISASSPQVTWSGGPYTAVTPDPAACTPLGCDEFLLTVNVPANYYAANPSHVVRVTLSWSSSTMDYDLYVYDANGEEVNSSGHGFTNYEDAILGQLPSGIYTVKVVAFATVNQTYSGAAILGKPPADAVRSVKYKTGKFSFTPAQLLTAPDDLVFRGQALEPRSAVDGNGNIFVATIQGVGGGTDIWKSTDKGERFTYMGQPDGAQFAAEAVRGIGVGGGDEDIATGASGRIYVSSLWLGSVTMSNSADGGRTWVSNLISSDVPLVDRQWIAAHQEDGKDVVYLTFKQLGVLLNGTTSIFVLKSFDNGVTFPQISEVTIPVFGVQPGVQGNITVDPRNGHVYTVFANHTGNAVYVAKSTNGGKSFDLHLVHQGPDQVSYINVFPIMAVDRSGNLHVVYSDGKNVYLASSADQGLSWTKPARVNNGSGTKIAIAPWIEAGDAGKVDIIWWGTSAASNLDPDAQWKVFFAQSLNALAPTPTISQNAATGVFHKGAICVEGLSCARGTRNMAEYASTTLYRNGMAMIVYPDDFTKSGKPPLTYFVKQTGGTGVLSSISNTSKTTAEVRESSASNGNKYALGQNYPNPFKSATIISYSIPQREMVNLKVYNAAGQLVTTLENRMKEAGTHLIRFEAKDLPSGIYFYQLQTDKGLEVKSMKLVK